MDTKNVKEYREDGSLRYECTMLFIPENLEHHYPNRIESTGKSFIRINNTTKYQKDGSIEWRLIYNKWGKAIGNERGTFPNLNF